MKSDSETSSSIPAPGIQRMPRAWFRRIADRARRWGRDSRELSDIERLLASEDRLLRDAGITREDLRAEASRLRRATPS